MTKSKKHSPQQAETEQTIVEQVPADLMQDFIRELVALAERNKADPSFKTMDNLAPRVHLSFNSPEDWIEDQKRSKGSPQGLPKGLLSDD